MSLKSQLKIYLERQSPKWINGGEFERVALDSGYKASNASRRMRELATGGEIERKEERGSVWYRAKIAPQMYLLPRDFARYGQTLTPPEKMAYELLNETVAKINSMSPYKETKKAEVKGLF